MQQQAPSITDLPPDLLRRIFSTLLPSAEPQPLLDVGQQWLSLQLTCKAWAAALQADPPIPLAVSASLPPPGSVPWLQEHAAVLHLKAVNRLEVASVDDFRGADVGSRVFDWVQRHCGLPHADALWIPSEYSGSDEAYVRCAVRYEDWSVLLLAGHETVPASCSERLGIRAGAPVLALPECSNLQELYLEAPRMFNPHQPAFDSALLSALPRLRRLELVGFGPIYLDDLPASLLTLRVLGGQVTHECLLTSKSGYVPIFLSFPEHCCLDSAVMVGHFHGWSDSCLVKDFLDPTSIRALLPHLWRSCRDLELQVQYAQLADVQEVYKAGYDPDDESADDESADAAAEAEGEGVDLSGLLSQLAAGLGPANPLRRLAVNRGAHFVLPSGQLISAVKLLEPAAVTQAADAGLDVQECEGTECDFVLLTPRQAGWAA